MSGKHWPIDPHAERETEGDATALWIGLLGPPTVFLAHLLAGYALAAHACRQNDALSLHIASVIAIALTLGLGLLSLRGWRRHGREWPDASASVATRDRFLSLMGIAITATVVLTLLAQWIPVFFIEPCR